MPNQNNIEKKDWNNNRISEIYGIIKKVSYWPGRRGKKGGAEKYFFKVMAKNYPNFARDTNLYIKEAVWTPNEIVPKNPMTKSWRQLEKNDTSATEEKKNTTLQKARKLEKTYPIFFWVLKEKNCQPQTLYPEKISFRNKREIKTFLDEQKWKEFIASRLTLKEWLKEVLLTKRKQ